MHSDSESAILTYSLSDGVACITERGSKEEGVVAAHGLESAGLVDVSATTLSVHTLGMDQFVISEGHNFC